MSDILNDKQIEEKITDIKRRAVSKFHNAHEDGDLAIYDVIREMTELINDVKRDLLFDLDEIDNKPWRVFRQLAVIMPEYADTYIRYEAFYSYGGSHEVEKLIKEFEKTDDFKESGFPEKIKEATHNE